MDLARSDRSPRDVARDLLHIGGHLKPRTSPWLAGRSAGLCQMESAIDPVAVIMLEEFGRNDEIARIKPWCESSSQAGENNQSTFEAVAKQGRRDRCVDFPDTGIDEQDALAGELAFQEFESGNIMGGKPYEPLTIRFQLPVECDNDASRCVGHGVCLARKRDVAPERTMPQPSLCMRMSLNSWDNPARFPDSVPDRRPTSPAPSQTRTDAPSPRALPAIRCARSSRSP